MDIFDGTLQILADIFIYGFTWVLDGIILALGYTLYFILDGFMSIISLVVATVDLSTYLLDFIGSLGLLPPQMIFLLQAVGFSQALLVIGSAYGLRMALNLIPAAFTRI